ncbi:diguanylate cyclase domain-containing protein [Oleidesulfovibrio sp.]|uniref:diguanylate cyclase domain-containing protein n=1 Tax=Oleidesulfovibrio sp. TaxID=2909707 RepID=UPI003A885FC5
MRQFRKHLIIFASGAILSLTLIRSVSADKSMNDTSVWAANDNQLHVFMMALILVSATMALAAILRARRLAKKNAEAQKLLAERAIQNAEWADRERELRTLLQYASIGLFRSSLDGSRFIEANQQLVNDYGLNSEEEFIRSTTPFDVYASPTDRETFTRLLQENGVVRNAEFSLKDYAGDLHIACISAILSTHSDNIVGIIFDVTKERMVQKELEETSTMLQTLLDAMPNPFFYKSADGIYKVVNRAFSRMVGLPVSKIIGSDVASFAPPKHAQIYRDADNELFNAAGPAVQRYETVVKTERGMAEILLYKESIFDEPGKAAGIVGVIIDITSRKEMEEALRRAEERYRTIFMHALDGIFTCSPGGILQEINPAFARMFGYEKCDELLHESGLVKELFIRDADFIELVDKLRQSQRLTAYRAEMKRRNGSHFWVEISCQAFIDQSGKLTRIEGVVSDITQHMLHELELRTLATTDNLTGLANRYGLDESFERLLAQARRSQRKVGVAFIDLDGFKDVNDKYGHASGDLLLKEVGHRLQQIVRDTDVVARLGGDEFAVLLWDIKSPADLKRFGDKLLDALRPEYVCGQYSCQLGASIGLSIYPEHGSTPGELLRQADNAMYGVKNSGKNAARMASDFARGAAAEASEREQP